MMYLVFDTETTGFPHKDPQGKIIQPRIIQFAFVLLDESGKEMHRFKELIKPDGWEVPKEQFWIDHGYSTEGNEKNGVPISQALKEWEWCVKNCKVMVAHNLAYDAPIIAAEMDRIGLKIEGVRQKVCTMKATVDFCAIPHPSRFGFKWPKLEELHEKLFGCKFDNAHDALADVLATAKCFFELKKNGLIEIES